MMTCQKYRNNLMETMRTTITCMKLFLMKIMTFLFPTTRMRCKHWKKINTLGMMEWMRLK